MKKWTSWCIFFVLFLLVIKASAVESQTALISWRDNGNLVSGDRALAAHKLPQASDLYRKAEIQAAPNGSDEYYKQGVYRIAAAARARQAFIQLQQGNHSSAGDEYLQTMEQLRSDYEHHMSLIDSKGAQVTRKVTNTIADKALDKVFGFAGEKVGKDVLSHFDFLREMADEMVKIPPPQVERVDVAGQVEQDVLRIPVIPDSGYFRYIGKVYTEGGFCTGSLVGPGLALTNAHCIFPDCCKYGKPKSRPKGGAWKFRHEWLYESTEYPVTGYYTHKGRSGGWDGTIENDWAILELGPSNNNNATPDGYLKSIHDARQIESLRNDTSTIFLAGYNSDLNHGFYLSMHWGCEFDQATYNSGKLDHACDTYPGSSGSPVFLVDEQGTPHLIALNAGHYYDRSKKYSRFAVNPMQYYPTLIAILNGTQLKAEAKSSATQDASENAVDMINDSVVPALKKIWR